MPRCWQARTLSLNLNEPMGERQAFPHTKNNNNQNQSCFPGMIESLPLGLWTALYGTEKNCFRLAQNTPSPTPGFNPPLAKRVFLTGSNQQKKLSLCSFRLFMRSTCTSYWLQHKQLDFQMGARPNGATLCSDHRNFHWHLFQCSLHLRKV
jgi:hypothetical protein